MSLQRRANTTTQASLSDRTASLPGHDELVASRRKFDQSRSSFPRD